MAPNVTKSRSSDAIFVPKTTKENANAATSSASHENTSILAEKINPEVEIVKGIINNVPRCGYVQQSSPTAIEYMPRLSKFVNGEENEGPKLYVKRDDSLPLAGGGSKTRKLDYLVREAIEQGADVLITCGAVQSNHCRLTASAAAREGLECYILLEERVPGSYKKDAGGNNYIFALLGAKQIPVPLGGIEPAQEQLVKELEASGKKVYVIPGGGSNALGALGYARCATELIEQSDLFKVNAGEPNKAGLFWDAIVLCSGSGGTHTGILTGLRACGYTTPVLGMSVRFDSKKQADRIHEQCQTCVDTFFSDCEYYSKNGGKVPIEDVIINDNYVGEGYSLPTNEMAIAVEKFARLESIILDPVYTGKAAAGLLDIARNGRFTKDQHILFLHTGGAPSTYHYQPLPLREE
jgi:D-cysteine desulfhydrase